MSPRALAMVMVLGLQVAQASTPPLTMALTMPLASISTRVTSSWVRPAEARARFRMISAEVPLDTAMVLPFRSAMLLMPLSVLATTASARLVQSRWKILAWPSMHRAWAPWPIWEMSMSPEAMAAISWGPPWNSVRVTFRPICSK